MKSQKMRQVDVEKWLSSVKARSGAGGKYGVGVVGKASERGQVGVLKWMQASGRWQPMEVNHVGWNVAHFGAAKGREGVLRWLDAIGVLQTLDAAKDAEGRNLALVAVHYGCSDAFLTWLHARALLTLEAKDLHGRHVALCAAAQGHTHILKCLFALGLLNAMHKYQLAVDDQGRTMALSAAAQGHLDTLLWLHSLHANAFFDAKAKDKSGATVAHLAARKGHLAILKWLHSLHLLDTRDKDNDRWNVEHCATWNNHLDIVTWLHSIEASSK